MTEDSRVSEDEEVAGLVAKPPVPVPALSVTPVTDDDRQAYGRLLDGAFDRGLIGAYDYDVRLRELSEATDIGVMTRIVTDLPVFVRPAGTGQPRRSKAQVRPTGSPFGSRQTERSVWTKLVVLLAVVVVAMVILVVGAERLVHLHHQRSGAMPGSSSIQLVRLSPARL